MKCPICELIEMRVMAKEGTEFTFECPGCHQVVKAKLVEPETPNAEEVKIELKK